MADFGPDCLKMKVRCTKLLDTLGNPQTSSAWLTIGKVYHVLSVVQDTRGQWLLRLVTDSQSDVGLFPLEQFEMVSARIPDSWIVTWNEEGVFELTTAAWNEPGYWDRYFDNERDAQITFEREMMRIVAADP
jgi:hypothetical protein